MLAANLLHKLAESNTAHIICGASCAATAVLESCKADLEIGHIVL